MPPLLLDGSIRSALPALPCTMDERPPLDDGATRLHLIEGEDVEVMSRCLLTSKLIQPPLCNLFLATSSCCEVFYETFWRSWPHFGAFRGCSIRSFWLIHTLAR